MGMVDSSAHVIGYLSRLAAAHLHLVRIFGHLVHTVITCFSDLAEMAMERLLNLGAVE
jgi:hypothetical protein